jgi:3-dehydroquinate dehydratase
MPASQVLTARILVRRLLIWRHSLPALSFNLHTVGIGRATTLVLSVEVRPRAAPGAPLGLSTRANRILPWKRVGVGERQKARKQCWCGEIWSGKKLEKCAMTKILLVQGANLTFLGRREPEIYGTTTPAQLDAMLQRHAQKHSYHLDIYYTNVEGDAINRIYQGVDDGADGLVMNPAGFTYAGYALKDCIKGAGLPYVGGAHKQHRQAQHTLCSLRRGRGHDHRLRDALLRSRA